MAFATLGVRALCPTTGLSAPLWVREFLPSRQFRTSMPPQKSATRSNARDIVATISSAPSKTKSTPNTVLESPERLWEIGSSYWFPFGGYKAPDYLDGSLPGDRGFDPFGLGDSWGFPPDGSDDSASRLAWLLEGELYNGRVAMLAVVGVLVTEALGKSPWWTAPYTFAWPLPYAVGVIGVHIIFAFLEGKRLENFKEKGEAGHFGLAPFDPLNTIDDYNRQAEVRNARLAMLTFLGYTVQAWVTGKGPIENAVDHINDPFGANIFTYGDKGLQVVVVFLVFSVIMHLAEISRAKAAAK